MCARCVPDPLFFDDTTLKTLAGRKRKDKRVAIPPPALYYRMPRCCGRIESATVILYVMQAGKCSTSRAIAQDYKTLLAHRAPDHFYKQHIIQRSLCTLNIIQLCHFYIMLFYSKVIGGGRRGDGVFVCTFIIEWTVWLDDTCCCWGDLVAVVVCAGDPGSTMAFIGLKISFQA